MDRMNGLDARPSRGAGLLIALLVATLAASCSRSPKLPSDEDAALAIGHALAMACPLGDDPSDVSARDRCADRLAALPILQATMREPFLWGGQARAGDYSMEDGVTRFNPRVWRRLYASTLMFADAPTTERVGALTILHLPMQFRHALPAGAFPYPFWHRQGKWNSYSYSTTLHVVVKDGAALGALRSAEQDRSRPTSPRVWSGRWIWSDGGIQEPRVSLYGYLFSTENPHVARLDAAYRVLERGMRAHRCQDCHSPDNQGKAKQLELLLYPSQAISARHDIVAQLGDDQMPPQNDLGIASGISDLAKRADLLGAARAFESAADDALSWEDCRRAPSILEASTSVTFPILP